MIGQDNYLSYSSNCFFAARFSAKRSFNAPPIQYGISADKKISNQNPIRAITKNAINLFNLYNVRSFILLKKILLKVSPNGRHLPKSHTSLVSVFSTLFNETTYDL